MKLNIMRYKGVEFKNDEGLNLSGGQDKTNCTVTLLRVCGR